MTKHPTPSAPRWQALLLAVLVGLYWAWSRQDAEDAPFEAARAAGRRDLPPPGPLDNFHILLTRQLDGRAKRPARVLYFGTSEIGYDRVTSVVRRALQERFGDGGKGFVPAHPGWKHQKHRDVTWEFSGDWTAHNAIRGDGPDRRYGLGGVLAHGGPGARTLYRSTFSRVEVHFRTAPDGGTFMVSLDGRDKRLVSTLADDPGEDFYAFDVPDGPHALELEVRSGRAGLHGVILERGRGVVVDAIMLIGGYANTLLRQDAEHLRRVIRRRDPDLLVFQFGAKEANRWPRVNPTQQRNFRLAYEDSIARARSAAPSAACLVISNKDLGWRNGGRIETRPATPLLVEAERRAARNLGCEFFDLYRALGGEGTMRRWFNQRPRLVSDDFGHLPDAGARKVGAAIAAHLLDRYDASCKATGGCGNLSSP